MNALNAYGDAIRAAYRAVDEYRAGEHTPLRHERARIAILEALSGPRFGEYDYRYYGDQLDRIDRGLPTQGMMAWTAAHPTGDIELGIEDDSE